MAMRLASRRLALPTVLFAAAVTACAHHEGAPPKTAPTSAPTPPSVVAKEKTPAYPASAIDAALREEWTKEGLTAAPRADDATFLRRVYVDIAGTIPPPDVTNKFLADTAPDKRARMVDTLLASPDYAEHWMNYWDDVLMGRETKGQLVDRTAFRQWLRGQFQKNVAWNVVASSLIDATGQNGDGGPRGKKMVPMASMSDDDEPEDKDVNGAVNWTLKFEQNPQDLAGMASRTFLGVQIQCAQCHDHKTEKWKQTDFRQFANPFLHAKLDPIDRGKPMGGAAKRVALEDIPNVAQRFKKGADVVPIANSKPVALDGTDLAKGGNPRKNLAQWMTARENPYFAKAFVNRMWGHFLGRGFVDPVDDMRPSNPATMPDVLDKLAADFAKNDFDVRQLIRTICATEAYQLSDSAQAKTDPENKVWARFHLVPLGPEELLNAMFRATDLEHTAQKLGVQNMEKLRLAVVRQYAFLFDVDEEDDEPDYSGTVSQALTLLNGALVAQGARALPGSATADLVNGPGSDEDKVDALAVRVLSRHATADEKTKWVQYVTEGGDVVKGNKGIDVKGNPLAPLARRQPNTSAKAAAYEDVLWAMLNSSEFNFNH